MKKTFEVVTALLFEQSYEFSDSFEKYFNKNAKNETNAALKPSLIQKALIEKKKALLEKCTAADSTTVPNIKTMHVKTIEIVRKIINSTENSTLTWTDYIKRFLRDDKNISQKQVMKKLKEAEEKCSAKIEFFLKMSKPIIEKKYVSCTQCKPCFMVDPYFDPFKKGSKSCKSISSIDPKYWEEFYGPDFNLQQCAHEKAAVDMDLGMTLDNEFEMESVYILDPLSYNRSKELMNDVDWFTEVSYHQMYDNHCWILEEFEEEYNEQEEGFKEFPIKKQVCKNEGEVINRDFMFPEAVECVDENYCLDCDLKESVMLPEISKVEVIEDQIWDETGEAAGDLDIEEDVIDSEDNSATEEEEKVEDVIDSEDNSAVEEEEKEEDVIDSEDNANTEENVDDETPLTNDDQEGNVENLRNLRSRILTETTSSDANEEPMTDENFDIDNYYYYGKTCEKVCENSNGFIVNR